MFHSRAVPKKVVAIFALTSIAVMSMPLIVTAAPVTAAPTINFGAKLDSSIQPSNSLPAHRCADSIENGTNQACTWILNDAYGRPGKEHAPRNGTIVKLRLIAGGPGSFQLQIAKVSGTRQNPKAKVLRNGPTIKYQGTDQNGDTFHVEVFK